MELLQCSEEMLPPTPTPSSSSSSKGDVGPFKKGPSPIFVNPHISLKGFVDPVLCTQRVLGYMLDVERVYHEEKDPSSGSSSILTPGMRKMLVMWLREVCEAESYPLPVLLRTLTLIDKVLDGTLQGIRRTQLQLLATTSLSLSLKYYGIRFTLEKLCYYTDNSVTKEMVRDWELLVLEHLHWDIGSYHIPTDFIQLFYELNRRNEPLAANNDDSHVVGAIGEILAFCGADADFTHERPSLVAAASCVIALAEGEGEDNSGKDESSVLIQLCSIHPQMKGERESVHYLMEKIKAKIRLNNNNKEEEADNNGNNEGTMTTTCKKDEDDDDSEEPEHKILRIDVEQGVRESQGTRDEDLVNNTNIAR